MDLLVHSPLNHALLLWQCLLGYARVSTNEQDTAAQVRALKGAKCERGRPPWRAAGKNGEITSDKEFSEKANLSLVMETLENARDLASE